MTDYITAASLKTTLELDSETYADADIATAISGASQAIDAYKNTRFYPTFETNIYSPDPWRNTVRIHDLNGSTAITVTVDTDGDGIYETTWARDTDFFLDPPDAANLSRPWDQLTLRRQSGRRFPGWQRSLKIEGSFGWATAPPQVTQSATILATRYVKRARETPYGLLTIVGDAVAAARLGKIDPDVAFLLDNLGASTPRMIA
jgi:hypothetical protein